jgi:hypothetical protein
MTGGVVEGCEDIFTLQNWTNPSTFFAGCSRGKQFRDLGTVDAVRHAVLVSQFRSSSYFHSRWVCVGHDLTPTRARHSDPDSPLFRCGVVRTKIRYGTKGHQIRLRFLGMKPAIVAGRDN